MNYSHIIAETRGQVGLLRLNRPQALNALSSGVIAEIADGPWPSGSGTAASVPSS